MSDTDDPMEAALQALLARLKAKEDAKNGPGAFDHSVRQGMILMTKKAHELTDEERAVLDAPPPAQRS